MQSISTGKKEHSKLLSMLCGQILHSPTVSAESRSKVSCREGKLKGTPGKEPLRQSREGLLRSWPGQWLLAGKAGGSQQLHG